MKLRLARALMRSYWRIAGSSFIIAITSYFEASSDLIEWTPLIHRPILSKGKVSVCDPVAANGAARFAKLTRSNACTRRVC